VNSQRTPGTGDNELNDKTDAAELVVIDCLDIFTVWHLLRVRRSFAAVAFLCGGTSVLARTAIAIAAGFGIRVVQEPSPYEEQRHDGAYAKLSQFILGVAIDKLEPRLANCLATASVSDKWERSRLARYLVLSGFRQIKLAAEAAEAGRRNLSRYGRVRVLVQSGHIADAVREAMAGTGVTVQPYRAGLRWNIVPRDGFLERENNPWRLRAAILDLRKVAGVTAFVCLSLLKPGRRTVETGDAERETADVLAITGQPDPSDFLDDLFWAADLKRDLDARVDLMHSVQMTGACAEFYKDRVAGLYDLREILLGNDTGIRHPRTLRRAQFLAICNGAVVAVGMVLRGILPPTMAISCLAMFERVGFYEAWLRSRNCRLVWTMMEGHEFNTQALAIAANRVGGVSLGTSWSLKFCPCLSSSNNRNDVTFVWGGRHQALFRDSAVLSRRLVRTGYPTARSALAMRLDARPDRPVLTYYDNGAGKDTALLPEAVGDSYRVVLEVARARPDCAIRIKSKRDMFQRQAKPVDRMLRTAIAKGNVEVSNVPADLATGLNSTIVAGTCIGTLPLLAAQHGVSCVLYDPERLCAHYPVGAVPNLVVCDTAEGFRKALLAAIDAPMAAGASPGGIDAFADGRAGERTAEYMGVLIRAFRNGETRDSSLAAADRRFRDTWGDDAALAICENEESEAVVCETTMWADSAPQPTFA
jgi:hypothetical protein